MKNVIKIIISIGLIFFGLFFSKLGMIPVLAVVLFFGGCNNIVCSIIMIIIEILLKLMPIIWGLSIIKDLVSRYQRGSEVTKIENYETGSKHKDLGCLSLIILILFILLFYYYSSMIPISEIVSFLGGCNNLFCSTIIITIDILLKLMPIIWGLSVIKYLVSKDQKGSLISKTEHHEIRSKNKDFGCLSLIILVLFILGIGIYSWFYKFNYDSEIEDLSKIKFDSEKWQCVDRFIYRNEMYEDLKNNYLKPGLKIKESVSLLGSPEYIRKYNNFFYKRVCLQYYLGQPGYNHVGYYLIICPTSNDNYIKKVFYISDRKISKLLDGGKKFPYSSSLNLFKE